MSNVMDVALIGVGGYGSTYIPTLLAAHAEGKIRFIGGVDPAADRAVKIAEVRAANVPVYASMDELYAKGTPHLAILSTPIPLHASQTEYALRHGSHVLCEKPIAAVPADAKRMRDARDATGKHVAIGYQWSFSAAVQALKADALAGVFGKLKRMRTVVLWPRDDVYYARNDWAGAIKNRRGDWVLDSPVNNACAHHLHHMLYVAGESIDRSATPICVSAELYRANPIQNFDTAALRVDIAGGAELLFYVTHAGQAVHHPTYRFEFENAVVESLDVPDAQIIATFKDGRTKTYGTPATDYRDGKFWSTLRAIKEGTPSLCGIEAATPHCQVVWACHQASESIKTFPADVVYVDQTPVGRNTRVKGLDDTLLACFEQGKLPSELGVPWAIQPQTVDVEPV